MTSFSRNARFIVALGAVLTMAVACQGAPNATSGYVPAGANALSAPQARVLPAKKATIVSSCGDHIKIKLLGTVVCRFHEKGYNGTFTLTDYTNGLISITPSSGTKKTPFSVTGLLVGGGYFIVQDKHGNTLKVTVKVKLKL